MTTTETNDTSAITVDTTGAGTATATVDREALDAEASATEEAALLAGKFKTPADLEKAYTELQKKLGAGGGTEEDTSAATEETTEETTEEEAEATTEEGTEEEQTVYGKAIDTALAAAEVDATVAAAEFAKDGDLSIETYEKFEKAGFPKEVVEAYIRGIAPDTAAAEGLAADQIAAIKTAVGGDDAYGELQAFISSQFKPAERESFNATVQTGDLDRVMAAVTAAKARFTAEIGNEGELLGGKPVSENQGYGDETEMMADMRKPEYKKSQAFREEVAAKIQASSFHVTR